MLYLYLNVSYLYYIFSFVQCRSAIKNPGKVQVWHHSSVCLSVSNLQNHLLTNIQSEFDETSQERSLHCPLLNLFKKSVQFQQNSGCHGNGKETTHKTPYCHSLQV